jgi:release factor glutamine methyltransferase
VPERRQNAEPTWAELRNQAEAALANPSEARWLLEEVSGLDGAELLAEADRPAPGRAVRRVDELVARRRAGEPLQYVLGSWSFRGVDLMVDSRVLIPRPETEMTVEVAIEEVGRAGKQRGRADPWGGGVTTYAVADLGTGSGALALALAAELPDAEVWATDASADALEVARANVAGIGTPGVRVRLAEGSWYEALPERLRGALALVVSNPPYVARDEMLPPEVADHEPVEALVSGPTGLEAIEIVVGKAPGWLEPDGVLVCELAPHQAEAALGFARGAGFAEVSVRSDLAGRDRVLVARHPG